MLWQRFGILEMRATTVLHSVKVGIAVNVAGVHRAPCSLVWLTSKVAEETIVNCLLGGWRISNRMLRAQRLVVFSWVAVYAVSDKPIYIKAITDYEM